MEPPLYGLDVSAAVVVHVVVFRNVHISGMTANAVAADQDLKLGVEIVPEKINVKDMTEASDAPETDSQPG